MSGSEGFSVALGLVDYALPILYFAFAFVTVRHLYKKTNTVLLAVFITGAVVSVVAALIPPTIKLCAGLGISDFEEPIYPMTVTNVGLLVSAIALFMTTFEFSKSTYIPVLFLPTMAAMAASSSGGLKSIGIGAGAIAIILIDITLIIILYRIKSKRPLIFVAVSMMMVFALGFVGMALDGTKAESHWVMEFVNIINLSSLLIAAHLTFKGCEEKSDNVPV